MSQQTATKIRVSTAVADTKGPGLSAGRSSKAATASDATYTATTTQPCQAQGGPQPQPRCFAGNQYRFWLSIRSVDQRITALRIFGRTPSLALRAVDFLGHGTSLENWRRRRDSNPR